jgi:hypothetical protein
MLRWWSIREVYAGVRFIRPWKRGRLPEEQKPALGLDCDQPAVLPFSGFPQQGYGGFT